MSRQKEVKAQTQEKEEINNPRPRMATNPGEIQAQITILIWRNKDDEVDEIIKANPEHRKRLTIHAKAVQELRDGRHE